MKFQWITLEQAKHGMLHVRFTWLNLSALASDLPAVREISPQFYHRFIHRFSSLKFYSQALTETQLLRVTTLASAIVSVYIDSASDLPQARVQSKPDPYAILSVGKVSKQTAAFKRTDLPVWEQGFTFLVGNPENDTLQIRIVDQKTGKDLGQFTYILNILLTKNGLQTVSQPFQLQKSGPTSKITMSLALKIVKRPENVNNDTILVGETPMIRRQASQASQASQPELADQKGVKLAEYPTQLAEMPAEALIEKAVTADFISNETGNQATDAPNQLRQLSIRQASTLSSSSMHARGRILITLLYSTQRQRLSVTVHKIE